MVEATQLSMVGLGWEFFQDSPEGGKWFKFDKDGKPLGVEGDEMWLSDWNRVYGAQIRKDFMKAEVERGNRNSN